MILCKRLLFIWHKRTQAIGKPISLQFEILPYTLIPLLFLTNVCGQVWYGCFRFSNILNSKLETIRTY